LGDITNRKAENNKKKSNRALNISWQIKKEPRIEGKGRKRSSKKNLRLAGENNG